jgi:hypothetical protein
MTQEEVKKSLQEWAEKRDSYPCPLKGAPCPKTPEGCFFYTPQIEARVVGPNLPPLFTLDHICLFVQIFNQVGDVLSGMAQRPAPRQGPVVHPGSGLPFLPPGIGPFGRGPN